MARFTYVTDDWRIKDLKKVALDKDVNAKDIIDASLMFYFMLINDNISLEFGVDSAKIFFDKYLEERKNVN